MADNRLKLAQGLRNLPPEARQDLAQREEDMQRGKTVELLRRAGKEMYENPIVNTAIGIAPGASDIQAIGEFGNSLVEGRPWYETLGWGASALPGIPNVVPMLKTVWHGSPHSFEKFDLSKIGTGEGAQAYGHGLYLAESPDVATEYSKMSGMVQPPPRRMFQGIELTPGTPEYHAGTLLERSTLPAARKEVAGWIKDAENWSAARKADPKEAQVLSGWSKTLEMLNQAGKKSDFSVAEGGNLYKVDLPDEQIAKMLDWDKPFSQQNETVREALKRRIVDVQPTDNFDMGGNARLRDNRMGQIDPNSSSPWLLESASENGTSRFSLSQGDVDRMFGTKDVADLTGEQIISRLAQERGSQAAASQYLNELGIPGIQYLDQASRGAGDGTRNYVVFSDEIPQILERNNQPLVNALRNTETPKNKFNITTKDASDIFGEGSSRIRYQEPNSQGFIDVLQRPDGTASVLGLEVPETSRGKGIGQSLQQQVLSDFPEMQGQVSSKAAATTAHRLGRRPVGNPEATLDDVFRMIDEDSSVNLVSPEMQKRFNFGSQ